MSNLFIKLKEDLNINDFEDINNLKNICIDYDNTYLKLEIDFKLDRSESSSNTIESINEFMLFDGSKLIGYAGICDFGGNEIEVNGMVHPDYRRKGIFTRLFSLVNDEFKNRDADTMLLLSDSSSAGGIEFIKNITEDYAHSEYDMNLYMYAENKCNFDNLNFRKAESKDVNTIAKASFEFFHEGDIEGISSGSTYLIEKDNSLIGKVRLEIADNVGGIYGLEVLPGYRGKGYGRELLILSINKLKESNVKAINLQVETKNKNALKLYKSCGFNENYTMDYYRLKK